MLYLIRGLALNITVELHEKECRSGQLRKKVVLRGHYYKFDRFTQKIIPVLICLKSASKLRIIYRPVTGCQSQSLLGCEAPGFCDCRLTDHKMTTCYRLKIQVTYPLLSYVNITLANCMLTLTAKYMSDYYYYFGGGGVI